MIAISNKNKGFTLIELLVGIAISGIVMAAIYSAYDSQQKAHVTQQQVVDMQQNIRAAMYLMQSEIRMAGYDPTGNAGAKIIIADVGELRFQIDENEDGNPNPTSGTDPNEQIRYALTNDADGDGIANGSPCNLGREIWVGGLQSVAEDIHAIGFAYAYDDDKNGQLDTSAGGNVIWAIDSNNDGTLDMSLDTNDDGDIDTNDAAGGVALAAVVNINRIRAVRIWFLARTGAPIRGYSDTGTYVVGDRRITPVPGDSFQRRLLTASVKCRNMGL